MTDSAKSAAERIELVEGGENSVKLALQLASTVKKYLDGCFDYTGPSVQVNSGPVWEAITQLRGKGVRLRFVTEITKGNISYCKEMMKYVQVRHIDGVKGNFGISDGKDYLGHIIQKEGQLPTQLLHINIRAFVEYHQYLFESLWKLAIPAEQKIKEIEEGLSPDVIETIRDPVEIQKLGLDMIKSSKDEVLIIFSTSNAFHRQDKAGTTELLMEVAVERGINVRILAPINDLIKERLRKLREEGTAKMQRIDIRNIQQPLQTRVTILVVDKMLSLAVELKDDTKDNSYEAIGLATYSNSKSTVLSYASIFESIWIQSELYGKLESANEQLKVHDKIQREFIDIAAHELRNPIQPILGLTSVLRSKKSDPNQNEEFLDIINRNATRLKQLTEDILDVTRIESRSLSLNNEIFNLDDIIRNTVNDIINRDIRNNQKNTMNLLYEPHNVFIEADKGRLTQVIYNLLNNAVKFTKGCDGWTITIEVKKKVDEIIVSIKDTGRGIHPEIFPRLFTKFVTGSEAGGTGLGLFISKSIVEAHGGKIWAENNPDGRGATFSFSLPANITL